MVNDSGIGSGDDDGTFFAIGNALNFGSNLCIEMINQSKTNSFYVHSFRTR